MTNEEAIKHITTWLYAAPDVPPMQVVQALKLAVAELRADRYDANAPSIPAGQPLTLERLRGMDGQPVWIMESPDWGHWELSEDAADYLADRDTSLYGIAYPDHDCKGGVHQLRWIAYAYPPAHIDRESLEPCECCRSAKYMNGKMMYNFCPSCGRPLTEEAWAELEKRVRGVKA